MLQTDLSKPPTKVGMWRRQISVVWENPAYARGRRGRHRTRHAGPRRARDDEDNFRRQAHRRHAGRRAAAAHLPRGCAETAVIDEINIPDVAGGLGLRCERGLIETCHALFGFTD